MKKMMKQFTGGGKGKKGKRNQMQKYVKRYEFTVLMFTYNTLIFVV